MPSRKRDHKAEYQRRVAQGIARGLTKAQARGHAPRGGKARAASVSGLPSTDTQLWSSYRTFQQSKNLSQSARAHGVAPERLRRLVKDQGLAKRDGRKWISTDQLSRRVLIYSKRKERQVVVGSYEDAALAGSYWAAAHQFVQTNQIELLTPFVGQGVKDTKGRHHPLETDPNAIHRLAAAGGPAFHEIYRIVA